MKRALPGLKSLHFETSLFHLGSRNECRIQTGYNKWLPKTVSCLWRLITIVYDAVQMVINKEFKTKNQISTLMVTYIYVLYTSQNGYVLAFRVIPCHIVLSDVWNDTSWESVYFLTSSRYDSEIKHILFSV